MKRLEALKEEVVALAREPTLKFFDLARKLDALHQDGDPSFLADLPAVSGIRRRRMYYLLKVGRLISEHKLSQADAEAVGWTKLQIIARHLHTNESGQSLIEAMTRARGVPARSLPRVLNGQTVPDDCAVQFTLDAAAKAELESALLAFGAERGGGGLRNRADALSAVVAAAMAKKAMSKSN